jgi:hypothetical protein
MPIASLNRFTVPLSATQAATTQGLLMPKLKYRFRVTLDNFGVAGTPSTEITKQVMNVTRPEVSFEEVKLPVYNSTVKILGKHSFADAKLTIRDDASGVVSRKVGEQLQKQFDFFEQSSAASGGDYKFLMRIEMLDGGNGASTPNILETWECYGCYVRQTQYNQLSYGNQEMLTIDLTIQPDNCIQTSGGAAAPTQRRLGTAATASGSR